MLRFKSARSMALVMLVAVLTSVQGETGLAQVAAPGGYSISTSATTVAPRATVTLSWTAPGTHSSRDWVGLFLVGLPSTGATTITYKQVPSGTSGTMTFTMPATESSQKYEFRYLLNNGYDLIARTAPITVAKGVVTPPVSGGTSSSSPSTTAGATQLPTSAPSTSATAQRVSETTSYSVQASPAVVLPQGTVTVSWSAPSTHSKQDWIALFLTNVASNGATVLAYKYVPIGTNGTLTFTVPKTDYTQYYEFRYLLNNGYTVAAVSAPITVSKVATSPPPPAPAPPPAPTPPPPSGGTTSTQTKSAVLTWKVSPSGDVAGYHVYRSTTSGRYGAPIATLSGNVTSYQATGLQLGTTYFFVVTAYDRAQNESAYSPEVSRSIY